MEDAKMPNRNKPNHSHAWRGTWNRPMLIDEDGQHPFTIARMTDHNVRGSDRESPSLDAPAKDSKKS